MDQLTSKQLSQVLSEKQIQNRSKATTKEQKLMLIEAHDAFQSTQNQEFKEHETKRHIHKKSNKGSCKDKHIGKKSFESKKYEEHDTNSDIQTRTNTHKKSNKDSCKDKQKQSIESKKCERHDTNSHIQKSIGSKKREEHKTSHIKKSRNTHKKSNKDSCKDEHIGKKSNTVDMSVPKSEGSLVIDDWDKVAKKSEIVHKGRTYRTLIIPKNTHVYKGFYYGINPVDDSSDSDELPNHATKSNTVLLKIEYITET